MKKVSAALGLSLILSATGIAIAGRTDRHDAGPTPAQLGATIKAKADSIYKKTTSAVIKRQATDLKSLGDQVAQLPVVPPPAPPPPAPAPSPAPAPAPAPTPPPAPTISLSVVGNPLSSTAGWSLVAVPPGTPTSVEFWVDGALFHTEGVAPFCLFGDDDVNPNLSRLAVSGPHVILVKAKDANGNVTAQASTTVTQGGPDLSLSIRGIEVYPKTFTVTVGKGRWMCGFVRFEDGKIGLPGPSPVCDTAYSRIYSATERALSGAQQARADSVCIAWSSNIPGLASQPCPSTTPPALRFGVTLAGR